MKKTAQEKIYECEYNIGEAVVAFAHRFIWIFIVQRLS